MLCHTWLLKKNGKTHTWTRREFILPFHANFMHSNYLNIFWSCNFLSSELAKSCQLMLPIIWELLDYSLLDCSHVEFCDACIDYTGQIGSLNSSALSWTNANSEPFSLFLNPAIEVKLGLEVGFWFSKSRLAKGDTLYLHMRSKLAP